MIVLRNVVKSYLCPRGGRRFVFRGLSFTVPENRNIALIGKNGAGKSTLMRLLCGLDVPDSGQVLTDKRISWPVGLGSGLQGSLTGRENIKFVCRVQGKRTDEIRNLVSYVQAFADIGDYFDLPVKTYSSGMRSRIAFGLSLAFEFDYYLVDEALSVGDASFRSKADHAFRQRMDKARLILVTHSMGQVRNMCDTVLLLEHGQIAQYDDIEAGIRAYQTMDEKK
ncbi:ABC transporter ATP-binding protein [Allopusillimonas ginsengisoli]|uniref:ABC transporter ATP-binding protein n=1 Tax=Allopusillimonas ginsengisoli TaxID=453575 RepID=UPI00101F27B1|nr:ABC transporter ATP-binding protein [Allopusillimonas ginsengisoli]TEA78021.1 ABC transporter ATP-binding protein [Allopusillimonas ginsengisoli]